jgi:dCTP deaminase
MILTREAINKYRTSGEIIIEPFDPEQLGTVSYRFRAGNIIARICTELDTKEESVLDYQAIPSTGYLLEPGSFYLIPTHELLGSTVFAQLIFGGRSTGSAGLFIDVSASLGHVGCVTHWTLELVPVRKLLLFPGQLLGQITFWRLAGEYAPYRGPYHQKVLPLPSIQWMEHSAKEVEPKQ